MTSLIPHTGCNIISSSRIWTTSFTAHTDFEIMNTGETWMISLALDSDCQSASTGCITSVAQCTTAHLPVFEHVVSNKWMISQGVKQIIVLLSGYMSMIVES